MSALSTTSTSTNAFPTALWEVACQASRSRRRRWATDSGAPAAAVATHDLQLGIEVLPTAAPTQGWERN
eukprot:1288388-Pyramimonas_sp.AAC.2